MAANQLEVGSRFRRGNRSLWRWVGRHRRWVIPLVAIPALYLVGMLASSAVQSSARYQGNGWLVLASLALLLLAVIGPIIAAVLTIVGGVRTYQSWRRANGHLPAKQQAAYNAAVASQRGAANAWDAARILRADLVAGRVPPTIKVWEIVPVPGEVMFLDLPADYARYYGQDVSFARSSGFFFGHPLFVVAGLAAMAVGNASRRGAAVAQAREQWREHQGTRVIVTNQRIICLVGGRWQSFYYSAMTAVYPETQSWTLICQFSNAAPLMLAGHGAPLVSVVTMMMTHGREALVEHPSILALGGGTVRGDG